MPKVLLVSHDAGGAEVLSAWAKKNQGQYEMYLSAEGPAARIFHRDHPELKNNSLEILENFSGNDWLLTATSLEADLERRALAKARSLGVRSVSFLDHWDLFSERFGSATDWKSRLPDEVWVGDHYGYEYALKSGFPLSTLKQVENPYFEQLKSQAQPRRPWKKDLSILFIGEPISRKIQATFREKAGEYDDEIANMRKFLGAASKYGNLFSKIMLRLHPSEEVSKYNGLITEHQKHFPLALSHGTTLFQDIQSHDVIFGIESMALVVAVLLNKDVFSCVTGKPWEISLPHKEILRFPRYEDAFAHLGQRKENS